MRRVMDGIPQGKPCAVSTQEVHKAVSEGCSYELGDSIIALVLGITGFFFPQQKVSNVTEQTDSCCKVRELTLLSGGGSRRRKHRLKTH
jgi:hypothetical protein